MGRLAMMVAAVVLAAPAGTRADVVEVTGWQVNVRERPSKSGAVLVTLHRGERFELIERTGEWYHVRMVPSGRVGYVHSSLVRVIPGATVAAAEPEAARPVAPRPAPVAPRATTPEPTTPPPTPAPEPIAPAPAPRAAYVPPPRQSAPPPPPPPALDEPQREGFWIGFGFGYGSASVSADDFSADDREGSFTGFLKLGGTLNHRVLLGVESNAWYKSEEGDTLTLGSLTGTVTFYPMPTRGLFVKGGLGLSYMSMDVFVGGDDTVNVNKVGWGLLVGVGYDWRVGENISISPVFNYYYGKPGDVDIEGVTAFSGFSQNVVDFAVGVTFH
jgi:hypothetical protein